MTITLTHLERLKRLHKLLLEGQTGNPKELAKRLSISPRTLREDLQVIKEWGGDLDYNRKCKTYHYRNDFDLKINVEITVMETEEKRKIYGGRIK